MKQKLSAFFKDAVFVGIICLAVMQYNGMCNKEKAFGLKKSKYEIKTSCLQCPR